MGGRAGGGSGIVGLSGYKGTDHHHDNRYVGGQGDGCGCFSVELLSLAILHARTKLQAWLLVEKVVESRVRRQQEKENPG